MPAVARDIGQGWQPPRKSARRKFGHDISLWHLIGALASGVAGAVNARRQGLFQGSRSAAQAHLARSFSAPDQVADTVAVIVQLAQGGFKLPHLSAG